MLPRGGTGVRACREPERRRLPDGFDGLRLTRTSVGEVTLRVRDGGSGPPLLLLHGHPETHLAWGLVAGGLARDSTVVLPDLRGYGDSSKPAAVPGHESYGKRAMAEDCIALMARLRFGTFDVAGHDRGGRVAHRMAVDHPEVVRRLTVLDVIPTGEVWARADARFALGYWHRAFLAQPHPVPERLIEPDPDFSFLDAEFGGAIRRFRRRRWPTTPAVRGIRRPSRRCARTTGPGPRATAGGTTRTAPPGGGSRVLRRSCGRAGEPSRAGTTPSRSGAGGRTTSAGAPSTAATS
ncbi:alpha/beta fold hydrolase [Geodermatophilus sp. SYSU D01176]